MTDDVVRLSVVGRTMRRRWRSLTALTVVGALCGAGASLLLAPGYRTSSDVLLQGPRAENELVTEAQIAKSSVVLGRTAAALGWGTTGPELRDAVEADVLEGSVIRVTGTADTPERAKRLTDAVVDQYVNFSTQLVTNPTDSSAQFTEERQEALRQQITETNKRIDELHQAAGEKKPTLESVQFRTKLELLRSGLSEAVKRLEEAQATSSRSGMAVMGDAVLPSSEAPPTLVQLTAGGAALFLLAGLLAQLTAARSTRELTEDRDIAAALGAPVLSGVEVAVEHASGARWPRRRSRRAPAAGAADEATRYRRVLARLREISGEPLRLLIVVPEDDATAHLAVRHLALSDTQQGSELRVARVSAARPTVPEYPGAAGALVVLSAGIRSSVELMAMAEACADAGLPVLGAVVAHGSRSAVETTGDGPNADPARVQAADEAMAGSA